MHLQNTFIKLLSLALLLSFFVTSCVGTKFGFHIPDKSRDQFVKIEQSIAALLCKEGESCLPKTSRISGSGVVVKHNLYGSFVLTAGHVCELELPRSIMTESVTKEAPIKEVRYQMEIVNLTQSKYVADIVNIDMNSDLCLLFVKGYWNKEGAVEMASVEPFKGERVTT